METRICSDCGIEKHLELGFHRSKKERGGWRTSCKDCRSRAHGIRDRRLAYNKKRVKKLQEDGVFYQMQRDQQIKGLHRMALERYQELLVEQNFLCAICGGINQSGKALGIDHDHSCCSTKATCGQCNRGLLCDNCNKALGCFQDSSDLLQSAIAYLTKYARRNDKKLHKHHSYIVMEKEQCQNQNQSHPESQPQRIPTPRVLN